MTDRLHLLVFFLFAFLFASCGQEKNKFILNVQIDGKPPGSVLLEEFGSQIVLIDSTQSDKNGAFVFTGTYKEPGLYRLRMDDQNLFFVIDGSQIDIRSNWEEPNLYTVTGSAGSASLSSFLKGYMGSLKDLMAIQQVVDSLQNTQGTDSMLRMVQLDEENKVAEMQNYVKAYSDTTNSMPAVLFASQLLNFNNEVSYFLSLADGLLRRFPDSKMAA